MFQWQPHSVSRPTSNMQPILPSYGIDDTDLPAGNHQGEKLMSLGGKQILSCNLDSWKTEKKIVKLKWYDFARPECTWSSHPPQVPRGLADSTPLMHVCACVMVVRVRTIPKESKFILDGSARRWLIQRLELISLATRELITSTNSHELLTTTSILRGLICHKLKAEIKEGKSNETLLMQCWGQTLY